MPPQNGENEPLLCFLKMKISKYVTYKLFSFQFESRLTKGLELCRAADLPPHADPETGDCDKFFLGDRFHEANVCFLLLE